MSDERIKQIRERLEAATPGPWDGLVQYVLDDPSDEDVLLIANAPADIAYLLELVERLRAALKAIMVHARLDGIERQIGEAERYEGIASRALAADDAARGEG